MAGVDMQNKKDNKEPDKLNVLSGLVNIILKSLDKVNNLQAFVIAVGTLIILLILGLSMTPYLSDKLQTNSGIVYAALIIIFILAILVIWFSFATIDDPKKYQVGEEKSMDKGQEQYHLLRNCMDQLTEPQLREMINYLLTPKMQDGLTVPIIKGSFLNDMRRWGQLDKVETYLRNNFPKYFME
jgi:hypothetical protein